MGWVWQRAKLVAKADDLYRRERLVRMRFHDENLQAHEVLSGSSDIPIRYSGNLRHDHGWSLSASPPEHATRAAGPW